MSATATGLPRTGDQQRGSGPVSGGITGTHSSARPPARGRRPAARPGSGPGPGPRPRPGNAAPHARSPTQAAPNPPAATPPAARRRWNRAGNGTPQPDTAATGRPPAWRHRSHVAIATARTHHRRRAPLPRACARQGGAAASGHAPLAAARDFSSGLREDHPAGG